jgi:hypothetical protein
MMLADGESLVIMMTRHRPQTMWAIHLIESK